MQCSIDASSITQRLKARKAYHQELQTLHSENHVRLYGKHSISRKSSTDKKGESERVSYVRAMCELHHSLNCDLGESAHMVICVCVNKNDSY